ncbi:MAG: AraC family transcriptional regulator [Pseudomonadota bacterium]
MSEQVITRAEMVSAMEAQFFANVTERHGQNWQRLNTIMCEQGAGQATAITDFHIFELCHGGSLTANCRAETESGDHQSDIKLIPGALQYAQAQSSQEFETNGHYLVQQIFIEDEIFQEVAAGIAPGDPDNLKPLAFHGVFEPKLKQLAELILDEARMNAPGGELYADLLAQQIALIILRRRLGSKVKKPNIRPLSDDEISRVIEFMEANLEEVGGLDTLAAVVDMDVFSFTRAFKAKTGEAPHQFLIGRRLNRVKDMLLNSTEPLVEIAYATGFSNQSHMTASFSKHVGQSPGAYRTAIKK